MPGILEVVVPGLGLLAVAWSICWLLECEPDPDEEPCPLEVYDDDGDTD